MEEHFAQVALVGSTRIVGLRGEHRRTKTNVT